MKFVFAGGGTGGHLTPGTSVAEELVARDSSHEVIFVTGSRGVEKALLSSRPFRRRRIDGAPLVGGITGLGRFALKTAGALWKSMALLREARPAVVAGLGGYGSFGPVAGAALAGVPRVLLEQNSVPGRANRVLSIVADRVFVQFECSRKYFARASRVLVLGNPVRRDILKAERGRSPAPPGIVPGGFTLAVLGGSQGCRALNEAFLKIATPLSHRLPGLQIVHQTGPHLEAELREAYQQAGLRAWVADFIEDMGRVYAWADLVVSRAGATTIAELAARGLAAVLVPLPGATDNHQYYNARALEETGACRIVCERPGFEADLEEAVVALALDEDGRRDLMRAARRFARPDAARSVADEILSLARERA